MAIKVLVAEDDKFLGSAYRAKLTREGFEVKIATDGDEALEVLKSFMPDIIMLDLVMPRRDGFSTLGEIRKQDTFKNVPIIVASNLGQKEDLDRAMSLGATDYIIKSDMTMEALVDRINKTVAGK